MQVKDYGLMIDLAANADMIGIVMPSHQGPKPPAPGAAVAPRVLDVSVLEGIVDLSLKPEVLAGAKSKEAAPALGAAVEAVVQVGRAFWSFGRRLFFIVL